MKNKSFILGYPFNTEVDPKNLKKYESKIQADFEAEEWCEVFATSLKKAKLKYEETFQEWRKSIEKNVNVGTQKSPFGIGS